MSTFSTTAARLGTFRDMPVSHGDVVRRAGRTEGVCTALSAMWLASYAKARGADPFGGEFDAMLQDRNNDMVIRQVQQGEDSRSDIFVKAIAAAEKATTREEKNKILTELWDGVGFQPLIANALKAFGAPEGLKLYNPNNETLSTKDQTPFANLGRYIIDHPGLHFIKLPTHAVAAVCDDAQGDPYTYLFLDVNYGEFKGTSARSLKDFADAFFANVAAREYSSALEWAGVLTYQF